MSPILKLKEVFEFGIVQRVCGNKKQKVHRKVQG